MVLTVYVDLRSQPARSIWIFLKMNNIPFEEKKVDLFKEENKAPAYLKKFPAGQVPAIDDSGFCLTECVAILRYLSEKYVDPSKQLVSIDWYPKDLQKRARVDQYMSWQHTATRKHGVGYFVPKVIMPMISNKPVDQEKVDGATKDLEKTLENFEKLFLCRGQYIAGDGLTLADLMAVTEIMQPMVGGYDVKRKHPNVAKWMESVKAKLEPVFNKAHSDLTKMCVQAM